MKYDDASWHYGAEDFPSSSPEEYGAVHIALFLKWCFLQGWAGDLHLTDEPEAAQAVINGQQSATDFFFQYCDGKLTDEDFNEEGNRFAAAYYGDRGYYLNDFMNMLDENAYTIPEKDIDFEAFSRMLDKRLKSGKLERPFWQFWK